MSLVESKIFLAKSDPWCINAEPADIALVIRRHEEVDNVFHRIFFHPKSPSGNFMMKDRSARWCYDFDRLQENERHHTVGNGRVVAFGLCLQSQKKGINILIKG